MEATQFGRNGNGEPLVVSRIDGGFRVYAVGNPGKSYVVSGSREAPACTCREFQNGRPGEYCAHIAAVLRSFGRQNGTGEDDRYAAEERRAIRDEGRAAHDNGFPGRPGTPTQMLVKRSVSPDGRIDSLSVEFSAEVDGAAASEVTDRAARLLALQSAIVRSFLDGAKNGNGTRPASENHDGANGAALAEMVGIGGMDGKWGRRLFIRIEANGQSLRLFGNKSQLAEAIKTAGFARLAERIEEGVALRVPCRVITKPSPDGRFMNVERLLPVQIPEAEGRTGR
jgi:hypothetical protein